MRAPINDNADMSEHQQQQQNTADCCIVCKQAFDDGRLACRLDGCAPSAAEHLLCANCGLRLAEPTCPLCRARFVWLTPLNNAGARVTRLHLTPTELAQLLALLGAGGVALAVYQLAPSLFLLAALAGVLQFLPDAKNDL